MTLPDGRSVVLLCGPAGAGKTTAARASGLEVFDRDDPQWPDERTFRAAISLLAGDPAARAAVIRSGATSSARAKAASLTRATHVYLILAPPDELGYRIARRGRADSREGLASIKTWFADHDIDDGVPRFPGWETIGPPNVTPRPSPAASRHAAGRGGSRPWRRTVARVIRRDHGICWLCNQPGADSADHVTPRSQGGSDTLNNLAAVHHNAGCRGNRYRGDRTPESAIARLEALGLIGQPDNDLTW